MLKNKINIKLVHKQTFLKINIYKKKNNKMERTMYSIIFLFFILF